MGLTAAYSNDHAGVQGDVVAQLLYLAYVYKGYEAIANLGVGYCAEIEGQPDMCVPVISFSDDGTCTAEGPAGMQAATDASNNALRPRLLTNDPGKGKVLDLTFHCVQGRWVPRSQRTGIIDQGFTVPTVTLREHVRNLGFEWLVFTGHGWTLRSLKEVVRRVWRGMLRMHMLATTCRHVHLQMVMGTGNHFALVNPPPPVRLREIDAQISGCYKSKVSWARCAYSRAVFAPNGARLMSLANSMLARFIAAMLQDLNCPLRPARQVTRQQLRASNPIEGTEFCLVRHILAPLMLTLAAVAPPEGTDDDAQLHALQCAGMPRVRPWMPPRMARVCSPAFVDESVGPGSAVVAIVFPAISGASFGHCTCGVPAHIASTVSATTLGVYLAHTAVQRPPRLVVFIDNGHAQAALQSHALKDVPGPLRPYTACIHEGLRSGSLEICKAPREARGIRLADRLARQERESMTADRASALTHSEGVHHLWLTDSRTGVIYKDPRAEVLRRMADPPLACVWLPADEALMQ
eukprot:gene5701-2975_t